MPVRPDIQDALWAVALVLEFACTIWPQDRTGSEVSRSVSTPFMGYTCVDQAKGIDLSLALHTAVLPPHRASVRPAINWSGQKRPLCSWDDCLKTDLALVFRVLLSLIPESCLFVFKYLSFMPWASSLSKVSFLICHRIQHKKKSGVSLG